MDRSNSDEKGDRKVYGLAGCVEEGRLLVKRVQMQVSQGKRLGNQNVIGSRVTGVWEQASAS